MITDLLFDSLKDKDSVLFYTEVSSPQNDTLSIY